MATMLILGLGGHLLRSTGAGAGPIAPAALLFDSAGDGDPLAQLAASEDRNRPLGADERIDPDTAGLLALERLPGIGPALARRIVADRESRGAFGGINALGRVPGIGQVTLDRLAPHLSFSRRSADNGEVDERVSVSLNRAGIAQLEALPGIGRVRARAIVAFRDSAGPFRNIQQLLKVPGISPSLVAQLAPMVHL
jgi:competence ComEA-like helix-hairpin-helix protein